MAKGISLVVVLVVVIASAVFLGIWFGNKASQKMVQNPTAPKVPKAIEETPQTNKVVLDETKTSSEETLKAVSGTVSSISRRNLVLEAEGDRLEITVAADAKIIQTTLPSSPDAAPEVGEIALDQLRVGQKVDALIKIKGGQAVATNLNLIVGP